MSGSPRTLVVGDVMDDIVVKPHTPVTAGSDTAATILRCPGGSAANQAAWLAHCGGQVAFVGRVGRDGLRAHHERLRGAGVDPHLAVDPDAPTGTIVLLVDGGGERTMFVDRGANLGLRRSDVPPDALARARHLHLTGYSFFTAAVRAVALDLLADARRLGLTCSIDPSSVGFLRDVGAGPFLRWTGGADVCLPNHDEGRALTGHADPAAIVTDLARLHRLVVLKLGAGGCVVGGRDVAPFTVPAAPASAVDTTGAGDAFAGAFLRHWVAGAPPRQAAAEAVRVAALAVGRLGARPSDG